MNRQTVNRTGQSMDERESDFRRIQLPRIMPARDVSRDCQCQANACERGGSCRRQMTQEDLFCDECRRRKDVPHCHLHYSGVTADCVFGRWQFGG